MAIPMNPPNQFRNLPLRRPVINQERFPARPPIRPPMANPHPYFPSPQPPFKKPENKSKKTLIIAAAIVAVILIILIIYLATKSGQSGNNTSQTCVDNSDCASGETCDNGACISESLINCSEGDTRVCGSDVGECSSGIESCVGGEWSGICEGEVLPTGEICDGLDNNCDGLVDEGNVCSGGGGNGGNQNNICSINNGTCRSSCYTDEIEANFNCLSSSDVCCVINTTSNIACITGENRVCGSNVGECRQGNQTCVNELWSSCSGAVSPVSEICDQKDNDCNGVVDDGGVCGSDIQTQNCSENDKGNQLYIQGTNTGKYLNGSSFNVTDSCADSYNIREYWCNPNLQVNTYDCRKYSGKGCYKGVCVNFPVGCGDGFCIAAAGETESSCPRDCLVQIPININFSIGDRVQVRSGVLRLAVRDSASELATWLGSKNGDGIAKGSITGGPKYEGTYWWYKIKWNDGLEGWSVASYLEKLSNCQDGQVISCGIGIGECVKGTMTCVKGEWGSCIGDGKPSAEICDGKDNDCDGVIDAKTCALPGLAYPACYGVQECSNGVFGQCIPIAEPTPEVSGDYYDDNCNGQVDEISSIACSEGWVCVEGGLGKAYNLASNEFTTIKSAQTIPIGSDISCSLNVNSWSRLYSDSPSYWINAYNAYKNNNFSVCWHGDFMKKEERIFRLEVIDPNANNGVPYGGFYDNFVNQPYYQWVRVFDPSDTTLNVSVNWGDGISGAYTIKEGVWSSLPHIFSLAKNYNGQITVTNSRGESKATSVVWNAKSGSLPPSNSLFKVGERVECIGTCLPATTSAGGNAPVKTVGLVSVGGLGTVDYVWFNYWIFVKFDNGLAGWMWPNSLAHSMSINLTGPISVAVNTTNKWYVSAVDPWNGRVSYNVQWGETYTQGAWTGGHYTDNYIGNSGQKVEMIHNYLVSRSFGMLGEETTPNYYPFITVRIVNSQGEKITRKIYVQLYSGKFNSGDNVLAGQLDYSKYQQLPTSATNLKFLSSRIGVYSKPIDASPIGSVAPNTKGVILSDNDPVYTQPYGIWWKVDFENTTTDGWVAQDGIWKI